MGKLSISLLSIITLMFLMEFSVLCLPHNSSFGCIPHEKISLLKFKSSLVDSASSRLLSWKYGTDCCSWEGVGCEPITGHVIKLDLRNNQRVENRFENKGLDSSLLGLTHLNYLDLSGNYFQENTIPTFLGSLKQLQYLNLSNTFFTGTIPHHLGNLSNLHTLDLNVGEGLVIDDFTWVSNLSSLEYLDLSSVNLDQTKNLLKVFNLLPSLVTLRMSSCQLTNGHLPHICVNSTLFSNVRYLDLSGNLFNGEFPCFLQNMTSLGFLDLSTNQYNSSNPHFLGLKNLVHVNLALNSLQHEATWISKFMQGRCHLKSLSLEGNKFYGEISGVFKNTSACRSYNLEGLSLGNNNFIGQWPKELGKFIQLQHLDLSSSNITGPIPAFLGNLSCLEELYISENMLSGPIPSSLGDLSALREFNFDSNQLSGEIPLSLGQLSNLERIDMSYNLLNGTLSEVHFANLSKLEHLYATSNSIKFRVGHNWAPPFQLNELNMASSNIGGIFPRWLRTQKALVDLDLSNCSLSGTLPEWLRDMNLKKLYLPKNNFTGAVPALPSSIIMVDLSGNMISHLPTNIGYMAADLMYLFLPRNSISGSLPTSMCKMKSLRILELSMNSLSGNLLECWENFPQLLSLGLSSNELSGSIPKSIGGAYSLIALQLNDNHFRGEIPSSLKNCTNLMILDVGENNLSGKIPEWIGTHLHALKLLRLRSNQLHGMIPRELCQAPKLQIMDLANNMLSGHIPDCFGNFSAMMVSHEHDTIHNDDLHFHVNYGQVLKGMELVYSSKLGSIANLDVSSNNLDGEIPSEITRLLSLVGLNLSHNHLQGQIPTNIGNLKLVESLDLSNNHLSGKIPDSLSNLNFLSKLNVSNNNLSGQIPKGSQLQTLDDSSIYGGNPLLCGAPLPKCQSDEATKATNAKHHGATDGDTLIELCFVFGGFATGLWGFIGILICKRGWRQAYFHFLDVMISKMLEAR